MKAMHPTVLKVVLILCLVSLFGAPSAPAATSFELELEEAIYLEETTGDVEAAQRIYEKILADGDGQRSVLARVHDRLAGCYLKLGRQEDARQQFRTLIESYPEQTETVARARLHLSRQPPLGPTPWLDGEVLTYVIRLPTGAPYGVYVFAIESTVEGGVDAWQIRARRYHDGGLNDQGQSRLVVEQESLRPLRGIFMHSQLVSAEARYDKGSYRLTTHQAGGQAEEQTIEHEGIVFDNEEWFYLTRRLPLALGYSTSLQLNAYSVAHPIDVAFEVTGQKKVTVPAGSFDCFKAETSIGQTFFYSTGPERYLVKMKLPGATAELINVSHRRESETGSYSDEDLGFSLTVPGGWFFHPNDAVASAKKALLHLLDPGAEQRSFFMVTKTSLKEGKSLEKVARRVIASDATVLAEHTIREDSWRQETVGGLPALFVTTDFQDGEVEWSRYLVWVAGEGRVGRFIFNVPPEKLADLRPALDGIVAGLRFD